MELRREQKEPFLRYSSYLKKKYGGKVYRVSVDAGFSCPNRGPDRSEPGCSYCDEFGSRAPYLTTGEGVSAVYPVKEQIEKGLAFLKGRYKANNFILYFQAFSGTYAPVKALKKLYDQALELYPFKELSVSTRPDCVTLEIADLLASYKPGLSEVWTELGLQSAHDRTLARINRGHDFKRFHDAFLMLQSRGVKCAVHLIFGLPGESEDDMMETVETVARLKPAGVKIHDLHIPEGTALHKEFLHGEITLASGGRHLDCVIKALERLPEDCAIMRLTCDTPVSRRVVPKVVPEKEAFYRELAETMRARNTWQGKLEKRG